MMVKKIMVKIVRVGGTLVKENVNHFHHIFIDEEDTEKRIVIHHVVVVEVEVEVGVEVVIRIEVHQRVLHEVAAAEVAVVLHFQVASVAAAKATVVQVQAAVQVLLVPVIPVTQVVQTVNQQQQPKLKVKHLEIKY